MTLLCLASSTTPRRRNLLTALAQCTVSHFRSSSTKSSSWFLSSLVTVFRKPHGKYWSTLMWRQTEGRLPRTGASFCQPKNTSLAGARSDLDSFPLPEIWYFKKVSVSFLVHLLITSTESVLGYEEVEKSAHLHYPLLIVASILHEFSEEFYNSIETLGIKSW